MWRGRYYKFEAEDAEQALAFLHQLTGAGEIFGLNLRTPDSGLPKIEASFFTRISRSTLEQILPHSCSELIRRTFASPSRIPEIVFLIRSSEPSSFPVAVGSLGQPLIYMSEDVAVEAAQQLGGGEVVRANALYEL
jgi:hypothetical protein